VKTWQIAVIAVVVVAVGVGAFFGGKAAGGGTPTPEEAMAVLRNLTPEQTQQAFQGDNSSGSIGTPNGGFPGSDGNRIQGGGNAVSGSIIASDESSITVETTDGSTKIVLISGSTTISKTEDASPADLTTGEDVVVFGTMNDDGTVTATRIQMGADQVQFQGQAPGGADTSTTVAQ